jgi:hypothetical protein
MATLPWSPDTLASASASGRRRRRRRRPDPAGRPRHRRGARAVPGRLAPDGRARGDPRGPRPRLRLGAGLLRHRAARSAAGGAGPGAAGLLRRPQPIRRAFGSSDARSGSGRRCRQRHDRGQCRGRLRGGRRDDGQDGRGWPAGHGYRLLGAIRSLGAPQPRWPVARLRASGDWLALYQRTGTPVHPMAPLVKLLWFREQQPEGCANRSRPVGCWSAPNRESVV